MGIKKEVIEMVEGALNVLMPPALPLSQREKMSTEMIKVFKTSVCSEGRFDLSQTVAFWKYFYGKLK